MNRLSDIQSSLKPNLDANRIHSNDIEFVLHSFDQDDSRIRLFLREFADDIDSGYLIYRNFKYLDRWHFGVAKSSFRGHITSLIYSSLDGDNFVTPESITLLLDLYKAYGNNFILHQFQGNWGDGTCGRISMPTVNYEKYCYDELFLPRQWDELDIILGHVTQLNVSYICYKGCSIFKKSAPMKRFVEENNIHVKEVEIQRPILETKPVGGHSNTYVSTDVKLDLFSKINHHISYLKNSSSHASTYANELVQLQRELTLKLDCTELASNIFKPTEDIRRLLESSTRIAPGDVTVFTVAKDEKHIRGFCNYYLSIGVKRIIIIDNDSTEPLSRAFSCNSDIFVIEPRFSTFKYSKAFWLEVAIKAFNIDRWTITVDCDEYLANNEFAVYPNLVADIINMLVNEKQSYLPCFLLDVFSLNNSFVHKYYSKESSLCEGLANTLTKIYHCDNIYYLDQTILDCPEDYKKNNTVRWSFGEDYRISYAHDVRFRFNKTFDSLRKFPFFHANSLFNLNQGFHDLILENKKRDPNQFFKNPAIYPLVHAKLLSDIHSHKAAHQYHSETAANINSLKKNYNAFTESLNRSAMMKPLTSEFPLYFKESDKSSASLGTDALLPRATRYRLESKLECDQTSRPNTQPCSLISQICKNLSIDFMEISETRQLISLLHVSRKCCYFLNPSDDHQNLNLPAELPSLVNSEHSAIALKKSVFERLSSSFLFTEVYCSVPLVELVFYDSTDPLYLFSSRRPIAAASPILMLAMQLKSTIK
jgi:hypothetical protein